MLNHPLAIDLSSGPVWLLVVGVFVVTFLVVSWIASGMLFGRKRAAPQPPDEQVAEASESFAAGGSAPVSDPGSLSDSGGRFDFGSLVEKARVRVRVIRREPPRAGMTEAQKMRAVDMIRDGLPISEAARTVYPDFDRLDEGSREALEAALQEMAKTR
jgi:hypothetical protein